MFRICLYLITILIIIAIVLYFYVGSLSAYYIMTIWNWWIRDIRNKQNLEQTWKNKDASQNKIINVRQPHPAMYLPQGKVPPSLMPAIESSHIAAVRLEILISLNYKKIYNEINTLLESYQGVGMHEIDDTQASLLNGQKTWRTLWVKFLTRWAGTADKLPTLKRIVSIMGDDISLLHVSVFLPGTSLPEHYGISMGVLRYHFGIEIPTGQTGMYIEKTPFKWREGHGLLFDDTLRHSAFNHSDKRRIVIFADLPRNLGRVTSWCNRKVMRIIESTRHVKAITQRLESEGRSFN